MRWPFGPPHLTLKPSKKNKKLNKKQKQQKNKYGEFRAKWGGPSGHLTWPLNPPKKHKNKKTKKTKKQGKITKNTHTNIPKKVLFNYQWNFSFVFVAVQNFPFWQLGQKSAHPKHTIKIVVSARVFLKSRYASRNGHFWTKNPNRNSSYHFFCLFSSLPTTKNTEMCYAPIFIVF